MVSCFPNLKHLLLTLLNVLVTDGTERMTSGLDWNIFQTVLQCDYLQYISMQGASGSASFQVRVHLLPAPLMEAH